MKYHKFDNLRKYKAMKENNRAARYELYSGESFGDIMVRHEIRDILARMELPECVDVLVRGTGTGADSCIFAALGHRVTGMDLIPDAIQQARINTAKIGLDVRYEEDDICNITKEYPLFDIIYDSYCLQSIVSDEDRNTAYQFVHEHLKSNGRYIVSTAGYSPNKDYTHDIRDPRTGIVLSRNDDLALTDVRIIDGQRYVPTRRHYTQDQLNAELVQSGFDVICSGLADVQYHGLYVICRTRGRNQAESMMDTT